MYHIRNNAENSVRNLLRDVAKKLNTNILRAVDYLDDGSPACAPPKHMAVEVLTRRCKLQICLQVEINEDDGSAVFDFEGTGCEVRGNLNAPASVVHSAVIYCMRAMLDIDIPLNAGCLVPLDGRCYSSQGIIFVQYSGSSDSQWQFFSTITHCGSLWGQCAHLAAHRRRCATSIPCLRCQSRVYEQSYFRRGWQRQRWPRHRGVGLLRGM